MDIQTALEELSNLFDSFWSTGCMTDDEGELANEIEDTIRSYVKEKEGKI